MSAGANRHTGPIYDRGHVVRMGALHFKRNDRAFVRSPADNPQ